jgi:hypothetical protein
LAALDSLQKCPSEFAFSRMAFAMYRAEIEEFIAQGVLPLLLGKDGLQR